MVQSKKRTKKEKFIVVADCETDPFEYGAEILPFVWGVYSDKFYHEFSTVADFVDFVSDIDCICYAHNGGKFDWHFLLEFIPDGKRLMIINGRLSRFKIGKCEFRDSYNILPVALSKMEKDVIDYSIMKRGERDKAENKKAISDYLYKDCLYLYNYVTAFIERYGTKLTLAGAALEQWEAIGGTVERDTDGSIFETFSPYYYGGRCEVFQFGEIENKFFVYDINSAYPFAMTHDHPYGTEFFSALGDDVENKDFVSVQGVARGCFPFRALDGSLIFPDDGESRIYKVTGWEYISALELGLFSGEIIEHYRFLQSINFSEYVNKFFAEKAAAKLSGDKAGYLFAKLFLNSLYGKFGANPNNYSSYMKGSAHTGVPYGWQHGGFLGDGILLERELFDSEKVFYNAATAASVTGFVRAMLMRALSGCAGVIYCDTDSVVCTDATPLLVLGEALGEWELEGEFVGGAVGGKKLYAFERADGSHKTASKGVRLTPDEIKNVVSGLVVTYLPQAPTFSVKKEPVYTARDIMTKQTREIKKQNKNKIK